MTDQLLALVPGYGLPLLALIVFLSCLALPVPSSLVMLTSGSLIATGDLSPLPTFLSAWLAALAGDQAGFLLGRRGGQPLLHRLSCRPDRAALIARATDWINQRGGIGVFLSRWLFSPLGPYVNFIGGASNLGWARFSIWGALGELVWVCLYIGLGFGFAHNITAVSEIASDASGLLAAGLVTLILGWRLLKILRQTNKTT